MPISRRRCSTAYDINAKTPVAARIAAMAPSRKGGERGDEPLAQQRTIDDVVERPQTLDELDPARVHGPPNLVERDARSAKHEALAR